MIDMYHKLTYSKVGKFAPMLETALNKYISYNSKVENLLL